MLAVPQVEVEVVEETENPVQSAEQFLASPIAVIPGLARGRSEIGEELVEEPVMRLDPLLVEHIRCGGKVIPTLDHGDSLKNLQIVLD